MPSEPLSPAVGLNSPPSEVPWPERCNCNCKSTHCNYKHVRGEVAESCVRRPRHELVNSTATAVGQYLRYPAAAGGVCICTCPGTRLCARIRAARCRPPLRQFTPCGVCHLQVEERPGAYGGRKFVPLLRTYLSGAGLSWPLQ